MPGHLEIHPLVKTYDETRRSLKRIDKYLKDTEKEMTENTKTEIKKLKHVLEDAIDYIPREYHLKTTELRELYKRDD